MPRPTVLGRSCITSSTSEVRQTPLPFLIFFRIKNNRNGTFAPSRHGLSSFPHLYICCVPLFVTNLLPIRTYRRLFSTLSLPPSLCKRSACFVDCVRTEPNTFFINCDRHQRSITSHLLQKQVGKVQDINIRSRVAHHQLSIQHLPKMSYNKKSWRTPPSASMANIPLQYSTIYVHFTMDDGKQMWWPATVQDVTPVTDNNRAKRLAFGKLLFEPGEDISGRLYRQELSTVYFLEGNYIKSTSRSETFPRGSEASWSFRNPPGNTSKKTDPPDSSSSSDRMKDTLSWDSET